MSDAAKMLPRQPATHMILQSESLPWKKCSANQDNVLTGGYYNVLENCTYAYGFFSLPRFMSPRPTSLVTAHETLASITALMKALIIYYVYT